MDEVPEEKIQAFQNGDIGLDILLNDPGVKWDEFAEKFPQILKENKYSRGVCMTSEEFYLSSFSEQSIPRSFDIHFF